MLASVAQFQSIIVGATRPRVAYMLDLWETFDSVVAQPWGWVWPT